jgi:hypothetical protein
MTDVVNFIMLIAASIGSMALGILAAYGILRMGFWLMRPQSAQETKSVLGIPSVEREA